MPSTLDFHPPLCHPTCSAAVDPTLWAWNQQHWQPSDLMLSSLSPRPVSRLRA